MSRMGREWIICFTHIWDEISLGDNKGLTYLQEQVLKTTERRCGAMGIKSETSVSKTAELC